MLRLIFSVEIFGLDQNELQLRVICAAVTLLLKRKLSKMTCESEGEEFDELDTRFLEVCIDGDVEELIQLFEEIARAGETLEPNDLNCVDNSGRVSYFRRVHIPTRIIDIINGCLVSTYYFLKSETEAF